MRRQRFDSNWEYMEGAGYLFPAVPSFKPVTIPHDAVINKVRTPDAPSGGSTGYTPGALLTYRNLFFAPQHWENQSIQFEFEGIYMNAEIYINGNLACLHPNGYTGFIVKAGKYLKYGETNELKVICTTLAEPNSRWYTGAGIYRHVWLLEGERIHVRPWGLRISTPEANPECAKILMDVEIENETDCDATGVLHLEINHGDGIVAQMRLDAICAAPGVTAAHAELEVCNAKLWDVDTPELYTLHARLEVNDKRDEAQSHFGIRSITWNTEDGLLINGRSVKLRGGCIHHDNGPLGAAAFDRAEERKLEILKNAGYNAIRSAHNPPSPALLDACDRIGLYVIDEAFDCWRRGKNMMDYHVYFEDWWQRDLESMVLRDFNHPSVIIWSYGNEIVERDGNSDGNAWSRRLSDALHRIDPYRPTNIAVCQLIGEITSPNAEDPAKTDYNAEALIGFEVDPDRDPWGDRTEEFFAPADICGYNYMQKRYLYDLDRFPNRIILGTETFPHEIYDYWMTTLQSRRIVGDFVWTSFDYLGEAGIGKVLIDAPATFRSEYPWFHAYCGDFDICGFKRPQSYFKDLLWRKRDKPYIGVYRPEYYGREFGITAWGWEPVVDSWTFPGDEGKMVWVDVYCKDEEVELLINGVSVGRKPAGAAAKNKVRFDTMYVPGEIAAVGYNGGVEVSRETIHTAGAPEALRITADRTELQSENSDLSYITVSAVDAAGERIRWYEDEITFEIDGSAELIAVGSGNPKTTELFGADHRTAFEGRVLAIVRSTGVAGQAILRARAQNLKEAECRITII